MEHAVRGLSVTGALRGARAEASEPGRGPTPPRVAVTAAGTKDAGLCPTDEAPQRDRRHAERVGASARNPAGALPGMGQGSTAALFCGRGVQPQTVDPPQGVGTRARADGDRARRGWNEGRARPAALAEKTCQAHARLRFWKGRCVSENLVPSSSAGAISPLRKKSYAKSATSSRTSCSGSGGGKDGHDQMFL